MTNQVNQAFEKWFDDKFKDLNPSGYSSNSFEIGKSNMSCGWQAATKASESEINSLKQRVAELEEDVARENENAMNNHFKLIECIKSIHELTASNNQLREALTQLTALKFSTASHIQKLDAVDKIANKALSSTPAQSLVERDNATIERIATALENAEGELKYLPEYVALVRGIKVTP